MTTEQLIILGFLALAFLAGWIARALVGRVVSRLSQKGPQAPAVSGAEATGTSGKRAIGTSSPQTTGSSGKQPTGMSRNQPTATSSPPRVPRPSGTQVPAPAARDFKAAVRLSRDELARAVRAYHAAVVRTFRNGADRQSGQSSLEALSVALVSLARAVDHEARAFGTEQELTARLQTTGIELRRLADDVMRHSRKQDVPAGVFDQLEQHLISTASMILEPARPEPI